MHADGWADPAPHSHVCPFCQGRQDAASEVRQVPCNVREFVDQRFTVWRCSGCDSLHCLEAIDADLYYRDYPVKRIDYSLPLKVALGKRLRQLQDWGLRKGMRLLDYGCGSGHFVRFARSKGILAEGYDPYSEEFCHPSVLDEPFDLVTTQDVLEHVEDPVAHLADLRRWVRPGGMIAIGVPNASAISLDLPSHSWHLHQPYHRHIPSTRAFLHLLSGEGWADACVSLDFYADTRFPFLNAAFMERYLVCAGGVVDAIAEPIRADLLLRHPALLFWAFFGSLTPCRASMVGMARRSALPGG